MNKLNINAMALAVGLAFSAGAIAEVVSKDDYQAGKDRISADYKTAKVACASLSGNAHDICSAESKGREKVAMAELESGYKPTAKNRYDVRITKAEATYAVAKEHCDDLAGNAKDVCVKEARANETAAKADAKAQMKTSDANTTANEKTADARKDSTADKLDADYGVAKEKCDAYAGSAKDNCLDQAKARFGKS